MVRVILRVRVSPFAGSLQRAEVCPAEPGRGRVSIAFRIRAAESDALFSEPIWRVAWTVARPGRHSVLHSSQETLAWRVRGPVGTVSAIWSVTGRRTLPSYT